MDSPLAVPVALVLAVALALALQRAWPLRSVRPAIHHRVRRNLGISLIVFVVGGAAGLLSALPAQYAEDHDVGLLRFVDAPAAVAAAVGFVAFELVFYWLHRIEHRCSPLWRIHRAHHTDLDMDVTTSIRSHPFDIVLSNLVFGAVVVLPLGLSPSMVAGYNLFSFGVVWLQHARTDLPVPIARVVDAVFMSPANHRMHHSCERRETDSNYGATIIWLDRLFGSYTTARRDVTYGLDRLDIGARQSVRRMLGEPFRADELEAQSWRESSLR